MASIKKRKNSYLVTVSNGYSNNGKKIVHTKTFKKPSNMTEKQFDKKINELAIEFEKEVKKGLHINSNMKLSEYFDLWFKEYADKQLQPRTLESYHYEINTKILPALGHIRMDKLTPIDILAFLNSLMDDNARKDGKAGGYSNRIIKYQWQILSSALQQAVYWQILTENICKKVKVPKNINLNNKNILLDKAKFYNEMQVCILLNIVKKEQLKYKIAVYIAIFCGLRIGEILGLTWNDINLERKTISINKSRSYTKQLGMITKYPKNKESIRTINISDVLLNELKEFKIEQYKEKESCGDLWIREWNDTPWLMTKWNGEGMYYSTLTNWLFKCINKYNETIYDNSTLSKDEKEDIILPVISFHKLRHTSATLLISQNVDIKTVSARLGHAQTTTTMNIYVHGLNNLDIKAANSLEQLLIN